MVCGEKESVPFGSHSVVGVGVTDFYPQPPLSTELTLDPWVPRVGDGSEWQLPWSLKNHHFPAPVKGSLTGTTLAHLDYSLPKDWLSQKVTQCSCQEATVTNQSLPVHTRLWWPTHSGFPGTFPVLMQEVSRSRKSLTLGQTRAVDNPTLIPDLTPFKLKPELCHICVKFLMHIFCSLLPPTSSVTTSVNSISLLSPILIFSFIFSLQKLVGNYSNQDKTGPLKIQSLQEWSFGSHHLVQVLAQSKGNIEWVGEEGSYEYQLQAHDQREERINI